MKTEDDKLKEFFNKQQEEEAGNVPDFESMWKSAGDQHRRRQRYTWRIAASVSLLIAVGLVAILNRNNKVDNANQIVSWNEPSKSLMLSQPGSDLMVLTRWTSPTDFLLPENAQNIK